MSRENTRTDRAAAGLGIRTRRKGCRSRLAGGAMGLSGFRPLGDVQGSRTIQIADKILSYRRGLANRGQIGYKVRDF